MHQPAQRLQDLPKNFFTVLEARIQSLKAAGEDVIRLDIGSPDMPPAPEVVETLARSAAQPDTHGYQPHLGPPALRQAWADMYRRAFDVQLDPASQVIPLMGSKEGIFNLISAWIDPGDVVLIPDPAYMTYARGTIFAGGEPYLLPLRAENAFLPDLSSLPENIIKRARMLWLNYPNNPTGASASLETLTEAVEFARRHGLLVCHDAAYTRVCFEGYRAPSILEVPGAPETAVEFNSLSKSHNMPGWRVGAVVGEPQALAAVFRLKTNLDSGHFRPILEAAITALGIEEPWLRDRNRMYQERRDAVLKGLRAAGLDVSTPKAAIYIWCPIPPGWSSLDFAGHVLENARVSLTPGTVFGAAGEGFVRISLASPTDRLAEAMDRIKPLLEAM